MTDQTVEYREAIDRANADFRAADGREMKEKCPYIFSSNFADAYWIAAYCLYHAGQLPRFLHKSIGYSWIADIPGWGEMRVRVNSPDQREGIEMVSTSPRYL